MKGKTLAYGLASILSLVPLGNADARPATKEHYSRRSVVVSDKEYAALDKLGLKGEILRTCQICDEDFSGKNKGSRIPVTNDSSKNTVNCEVSYIVRDLMEGKLNLSELESLADSLTAPADAAKGIDLMIAIMQFRMIDITNYLSANTKNLKFVDAIDYLKKNDLAKYDVLVTKYHDMVNSFERSSRIGKKLIPGSSVYLDSILEDMKRMVPK